MPEPAAPANPFDGAVESIGAQVADALAARATPRIVSSDASTAATIRLTLPLAFSICNPLMAFGSSGTSAILRNSSRYAVMVESG